MKMKNLNKKVNIEVGFISKLLETKDLIVVKDLGIHKSFFTGENANAFDFILKSASDTGEVPTVRVFKRRFPKYPLEEYTNEDGHRTVGTEESLLFWGKELRTKVKHNTLIDTIEEVGAYLQELDTQEAYDYLKKQITYIENDIEESDDVDITKQSEERKEAYIKKKNSGGMLGYSTGFSHLDYLTKGIKDGTLTTIIANTGVGKTFFLVLLACNLALEGCKVALGVTEMSTELMMDRFDAILFSLTSGVNFKYNDFKSGTLTPKVEKQFFDFLDNTLPDIESITLFTATSPIGVAAEVEKIKPDVVLIDGVYLMEDDQQAKDDWLRVTHITRDLKKLAKRVNLPIVTNTQADKKSSKKTGPNLDDIMYTQAVSQDSDDVYALFRDEVMINDNEMCLAIRKQREGGLGKIMFDWNFNEMIFGEIYSQDSEEDDSINDSNYIEEED